MLKRILAIIAALFTWIVVATIANLVLRWSWSDYAEVEAAMLFTLPMLLLRLVVGALASVCAGLAVSVVHRADTPAAAIVAGILFVFFIPVHYTLWTRFPAWYHVVFLASLLVLPVLGFSIAKRRVP